MAKTPNAGKKSKRPTQPSQAWPTGPSGSAKTAKNTPTTKPSVAATKKNSTQSSSKVTVRSATKPTSVQKGTAPPSKGVQKTVGGQPKRPVVPGKYKLESNKYKIKAGDSESVLFRPTEKTKRVKNQNKPKPGAEGGNSAGDGKPKKAEKMEPFRVMDLPKELRMTIWEMAVVDTKFFVWPDSRTGKEQPDLAMVSRQVRNEVLPIYYGKNIFAVDISQPGIVDLRRLGGKSRAVQAIETFDKWAAMLEKEESWYRERWLSKCWFKDIRNFAFSYSETSLTPYTGPVGHAKNFIISIKFKKLDGRGWTACIEIHREAGCIVSASDEYGTCTVKNTPQMLNKVVIEVVDNASKTGLTRNLVMGMVKAIKVMAPELVYARCEKVITTHASEYAMDESGAIVIK